MEKEKKSKPTGAFGKLKGAWNEPHVKMGVNRAWRNFLGGVVSLGVTFVLNVLGVLSMSMNLQGAGIIVLLMAFFTGVDKMMREKNRKYPN
jgi:hypothetical protein